MSSQPGVEAKIRVLVTGGHDFRDVELLGRVLGAVHARCGIELLIAEGRGGAELLAMEWATRHDIPLLTGEARGQLTEASITRLIEDGTPHLAVAFPGSHVTDKIAGLAAARGVRVLRISPGGERIE
ncbi:MAG: SLOG family protein [Alsobacter sp.]